MTRSAVVLGLVGLTFTRVLAQEKPVDPPPQHAPTPDNASAKERCRDEAHMRHCEAYRACNAIDDEKDRDACKMMAEQDEDRETKACDLI